MSGRQPPANIIAAAQSASGAWNIPASVLLGQWALESGWGEHMPPGSNNPFGEKALSREPAVVAATHEVEGGSVVEIQAPFRGFPSLADAFSFHAEHLATSHFYIAARACLPDVQAFCHALTGVYATDPHYGASLVAVITDSDLTQYDVAPQGPAHPPVTEHWSSCAMNNGPALPAGPCDCGGLEPAIIPIPQPLKAPVMTDASTLTVSPAGPASAGPIQAATLDMLRSVLMSAGAVPFIHGLATSSQWEAIVGGIIALGSAAWSYMASHPGKTNALASVMAIVKRGGQAGVWNGDVTALEAAVLPIVEKAVDARIKARAGILAGPVDMAANAVIAQAGNQAVDHLRIV